MMKKYCVLIWASLYFFGLQAADRKLPPIKQVQRVVNGVPIYKMSYHDAMLVFRSKFKKDSLQNLVLVFESSNGNGSTFIAFNRGENIIFHSFLKDASGYHVPDKGIRKYTNGLDNLLKRYYRSHKLFPKEEISEKYHVLTAQKQENCAFTPAPPVLPRKFKADVSLLQQRLLAKNNARNLEILAREKAKQEALRKAQESALTDEQVYTKARSFLTLYNKEKDTMSKNYDLSVFINIVRYIEENRMNINNSLSSIRSPNPMLIKRSSESGLPLNLLFFKDGQILIDLAYDGGILGEGSFKRVTKGLDYHTPEVKAIIQAKTNGPRDVDDMKKEIKFYDLFKKAKGISQLDNIGFNQSNYGQLHIYLIQERYLGSLDDYAKKVKSRKEALDLAIDYLTGLKNIHDKNWIHRDIKPGNLLVGKNGGAVTDFGISTNKTLSFVGTPAYMHPAIYVRAHKGQQPYGSIEKGKRDDVYSMGLSLELLINKDDMYRVLKDNFGMQKAMVQIYNPRAVLKLKDQSAVKYDKSLAKVNRKKSSFPENEVIYQMRNPNEEKIITVDEALSRMITIREDTYGPLN